MLIAVNWGVYIWAVNNGRVVDAALGYFINPLVSVSLGVLMFRERLREPQWVAVGLGACAVLLIAIASGRFPWIAVVLAVQLRAVCGDSQKPRRKRRPAPLEFPDIRQRLMKRPRTLCPRLPRRFPDAPRHIRIHPFEVIFVELREPGSDLSVSLPPAAARPLRFSAASNHSPEYAPSLP